jgi:hypothetical protein
MSEGDHGRPRHEATDATAQTVGLIAAALFFLVLLGILGGAATVRFPRGVSPERPVSTPFTAGAQSHPDIRRSWQDYERASAAHLGGYAWLDRKAGKVRIPLSRAMDLVVTEAQKGKP